MNDNMLPGPRSDACLTDTPLPPTGAKDTGAQRSLWVIGAAAMETLNRFDCLLTGVRLIWLYAVRSFHLIEYLICGDINFKRTC